VGPVSSDLLSLLRLYAQPPLKSQAPQASPPVDGFRPGEGIQQLVLQRTLRQSLDLVRAQLATAVAEELRAVDVVGALEWLADHVDQPPLVAARSADLGPALQQLGITPPRLESLALLLADALRAAGGPAWRAEYDEAWRSTVKLVARWMSEGMQRIAFEPPFWTAVVTGHERRAPDVGVLRLRTYLPYRWTPGQYASVEVAQYPRRWRPCWIGGRTDELVIHVRAGQGDEIADALVHATAVGDRVRLRAPEGGLTHDPDDHRTVLIVAHDTGIAPAQAIRDELRGFRRIGDVHLLWTVDVEEDRYALDGPPVDTVVLADGAEVVIPDGRAVRVIAVDSAPSVPRGSVSPPAGE
jgi:hypothetical protein